LWQGLTAPYRKPIKAATAQAVIATLSEYENFISEPHDAVIFALPLSGSDFLFDLFDPAVSTSSTFALTSQLLTRSAAPVF